jgi:hypothetical protein
VFMFYVLCTVLWSGVECCGVEYFSHIDRALLPCLIVIVLPVPQYTILLVNSRPLLLLLLPVLLSLSLSATVPND